MLQEGDDLEVDSSLRNEPTNGGEKHHLGNTVKVRFTTFGDVEVDAKVDSGATTSSLHADDIQQNGSQISFTSSALGDKRYTVDLVGSQEVHSADGGANERPMIKVDIEVDGVPLSDVVFNLNDRSNMESSVLLGENVLKAGNFVVDVSKDEPVEKPAPDRDQQIIGALETLASAGVTLNELVEYIQTVAIRRLKD